jgi:hypothetical protein
MTFSQDLSNNRDDHDERTLEEKVGKKRRTRKDYFVRINIFFVSGAVTTTTCAIRQLLLRRVLHLLRLKNGRIIIIMKGEIREEKNA